MTNIYELFKEDIPVPEDLTERYWYRSNGNIYWNVGDECNPIEPEEWGARYTAESIQDIVVREGFLLVTDSGYLGTYQFIFNKSNEVNAP